MRRMCRFVPTPPDDLEGRIVLSHGASTAPVVLGGLYPRRGILNSQHQSIAAEVNQVFDSFRNSYNQARATYFTSIQNQAAPGPATTYAFVAYTTQQVSLLAQQTLSIFADAKRAKVPGMKRLVATRIMGPRAQAPPGSLAASLLQSIPQPGTSAPTSSLYSLGQDNAIESARVAILNGLSGR